MSTPTPLQSLIGGFGLALPVHSLLLLNGSVLGISGFLHGAVRGNRDALVSVVGLLAGGVAIAVVEGAAQPAVVAPDLQRIILSGFLVGVGTKLGAGCTSGHMICGLSRFSPRLTPSPSSRSIVATATFFVSGALTAQNAYAGSLPPAHATDWSLGIHGKTFISLQAVSLAISSCIYIFSSPPPPPPAHSETISASSPLRMVAALSASFGFALALRLSNLNQAARVVSFLLLPFDRAFDPSLAYLSMGALPLATLLYHYARDNQQPRLGGQWNIPGGLAIDGKLVSGAVLFGIGWGLGGICPGPGLVNLGASLFTGIGIMQPAAWVGAFALGGLLGSLV